MLPLPHTSRPATGTAGALASIHSRTWSAGSWSTESLVAGSLQGAFNWHASSIASGESILGLAIDGDGDFLTPDDQEVSYLQEISGVWQARVPITTNSVEDSDVLTGYSATQEPLVVWRQDGSLVGLTTGLTGTVETITGAEIDQGLSEGQIVTSVAGTNILWAGAQDVMGVENTNGTWTAPQPVSLTPSSLDRLHDAWLDAQGDLQLLCSRIDLIGTFKMHDDSECFVIHEAGEPPPPVIIDSMSFGDSGLIKALGMRDTAHRAYYSDDVSTDPSLWQDLGPLMSDESGTLLLHTELQNAAGFYRFERN